MKKAIISEADHDIRLDRWFKRHFPGYPHSMLEKNLRAGDIRLDGKKAKSSDRIREGQELSHPDITINNTPKKAAPISAGDIKDMQALIIYKDKNIIIINKPSGLAVQGGTGISKSVDSMLDALQFDSGRPKLVHRIDKDTSGILVLARNAKVASILMTGFATKTIDKTYVALVHNQPLPLVGTIDKPIMKSAYGEDGFETVGVDEAGKRAITEYRVIDMLARKFSVMELKPLTGRTHQLRVHMLDINCPIVGDMKYGGSVRGVVDIENKLHLHAAKIVIPPMLGAKAVKVTAPFPKHMKQSFKTLGIDVPQLEK
jgi:23S rRNA pseudouridine955/2504/2580 synthase